MKVHFEIRTLSSFGSVNVPILYTYLPAQQVQPLTHKLSNISYHPGFYYVAGNTEQEYTWTCSFPFTFTVGSNLK